MQGWRMQLLVQKGLDPSGFSPYRNDEFWLFRKLYATKVKVEYSGRLRLRLNPLRLVRWVDSWPFDKTWKPDWIDSTWVNRFNGRAMNLEWIFIKTPSHARKSFSKASPYFFVRTGPVSTGTDSRPFNYFAWFQKIQPNEIHLMNLLHF